MIRFHRPWLGPLIILPKHFWIKDDAIRQAGKDAARRLHDRNPAR